MARQLAHAPTRRAAPNPIMVQKFLGGLDYPADKQGIIDTARQHGADQETMHTLERLPEKEYSSPVAVSRAVGQLD